MYMLIRVHSVIPSASFRHITILYNQLDYCYDAINYIRYPNLLYFYGKFDSNHSFMEVVVRMYI